MTGVKPVLAANPPSPRQVTLPKRMAGYRVLLHALLRNPREQCANLGLPVPAVTPERTDGGQLAGLRPPGDGLRVHSEHRRDLRWGKQRLGLGCACRHVYGLSSWTGTAILRSWFLLAWFLLAWCLAWLLRLEPVGMSYMANRDHIAITTGDTSTTRSKVFVAACPVVRLMRVTLRDSSDTYSRIVGESEKVARSRRYPPA